MYFVVKIYLNHREDREKIILPCFVKTRTKALIIVEINPDSALGIYISFRITETVFDSIA